MHEIHLAWLAGIWDGEGSIGLGKKGETNITTAIQLQMTCATTVERVIQICTEVIGVTANGYSFVEKQGHHQDSHHVRINRATDGVLMAEALLPYAVTKRRHWELFLEAARIKVSRRRVMPDGRLARGGIPASPCTPREFELYEQLRDLNAHNRRYKNGLLIPNKQTAYGRKAAVDREIAGGIASTVAT